MHFGADPLYGRACESWQLQIGLEGVAAALAVPQGLAGPDWRAIPAAALHVTVLPLIDAAEHLSSPKPALWARHGAAWRAAIGTACARTPPFRLCFDRLRADARAVIAQDGSNPLRAFRAALAAGCGLPERPVRVPDITHATLLRARVAAPPPPACLPDLRLEFTARRLRLVRELVFPTLAFELLEEFELAGQASSSPTPPPAIAASEPSA